MCLRRERHKLLIACPLVRRFGLQFAALDLLVTPGGRYVFVDLNSNGQWGWIENQTGLPLTETLVTLLEQGQKGEEGGIIDG